MEVNFLHRDVCGSLQKNLIHRQDSSKHRSCSVCAIFKFFCAWPSLGFKLRPMPQIQAVGYFNSQGVIFLVTLPGVDQAPSRRLPGKVRGTRRHNTPKNAAETYPKKNSSNFQSTVCWRSTFLSDSGIFHPPKRAFKA